MIKKENWYKSIIRKTGKFFKAIYEVLYLESKLRKNQDSKNE